MIKKIVLILGLFLFGLILPKELLAQESSEAFQITLFETKIKVLSPKSYHPDISALVINKMNNKALAKIIKSNGELIAHVALEEGEQKAIKLKLKEDDRIFYIPLSPAKQAVELLVGREAYEIPPKK